MAIDGVLIDLGGVIYVGDHALPGAIAAVERLRAADLPLRFLTNTTRMSKRGIIARLSEMGLPLGADDLFTPADAARAWLAQNRLAAHLLVHPDLEEDFAGLTEGEAQAVVVGDAGEAFSYAAMNAAFRSLIAAAPLLALARNRSFRDDDHELSLDAGAFVSGLEYAADCEAVLMGKPSPAFFATALASMDCTAERAVMIGDDVESDVVGALSAGLGGAFLVRAGKYRPGDEDRAAQPPSAVVDDFAAATAWVLAARS